MQASRARRWLSAPIVVALALTAGLLSTAGPAAAINPPVVDGVAPMTGPTAGGLPVRIYGSNFAAGPISVTFGGVASTHVKRVDFTLITAVVPPAAGGLAANNTTVDVSVTISGQTGTLTQAFTYSNATLSVSPSTGLVNGSAVTFTLTGYKPNVDVIPVEFNPLLLYVEQFPEFPFGPPPYVDVLGSLPFPQTNASGNLVYTANVTSGASFLAATHNGAAYDTNIACPANATTANYLGNSTLPAGQKQPYSNRCQVALNMAGVGSIEASISFAQPPERVPAAPVILLSKTTATKGDAVTIVQGSRFWTANPFFGSTKGAVNPGETRTEAKLCGLGGNPAACSTGTVGNVNVRMTRYVGNANPTPPPTINGTFTGANLGGLITIGPSEPPCNTCFIRVRQFRPGGTTYLEKTTPITIT